MRRSFYENGYYYLFSDTGEWICVCPDDEVSGMGSLTIEQIRRKRDAMLRRCAEMGVSPNIEINVNGSSGAKTKRSATYAQKKRPK